MEEVKEETREELLLTDLINVSTLQKMQDTFSMMTGMASMTVDAAGNMVTNPSNYTDFCLNG